MTDPNDVITSNPSNVELRTQKVPLILRPDELDEHVRGGGATTVPLVTAARGATTFLNGITKFAPGAAISHHCHNTLESVMIVKGDAIVDIDGNCTRLRAYDTTLVPAGIPHHFENASSDAEMWIMWIYGTIQATRTIIETGVTGRVDTEDALGGARLSETIVHEIAEIEIIPGHESKFEAAVEAAVPLFQSAPGARTLLLERSVEFSQRYRLVVGWDTITDHLQGFRNSPRFAEWRRSASPHFSSPPKVEHVRNVLTAF